MSAESVAQLRNLTSKVHDQAREVMIELIESSAIVRTVMDNVAMQATIAATEGKTSCEVHSDTHMNGGANELEFKAFEEIVRNLLEQELAAFGYSSFDVTITTPGRTGTGVFLWSEISVRVKWDA